MTPWATGSPWGMTLQAVLKESCSLPSCEEAPTVHESQPSPSQPGWETWANPGGVFLTQRPTHVASWGKVCASRAQPATDRRVCPSWPLTGTRRALDGPRAKAVARTEWTTWEHPGNLAEVPCAASFLQGRGRCGREGSALELMGGDPR